MRNVRITGLKGSAGIFLLVALTPATADVYKCMEPEGRIAFRDVPCPQGTKAEPIDIVKQPSAASTSTEAPPNPRPASPPTTSTNRHRSGEGTAKPQRTTKHSAAYEQWLKEEKKAIIQGRPPDASGHSSSTPTRSR